MPSSADQDINTALEASLNPVLPSVHDLPGSFKSKLGWNDALMISRSDTLNRKFFGLLLIFIKNLQSTSKSLRFISVNPHNNP